jgi:hypothetical protein
MLTDVGIGCSDQVLLLLWGHGVSSGDMAPYASGLHFGDDERLAPLGNDVYLFVTKAPVTLEDTIALALQIAAG